MFAWLETFELVAWAFDPRFFPSDVLGLNVDVKSDQESVMYIKSWKGVVDVAEAAGMLNLLPLFMRNRL